MIILKPGQKIRTLGLYQPYATLMLHGKIETRWVMENRKPPFPFGKYLIYSTQKCFDFFDAEDQADRAGQGDEFRAVLKRERDMMAAGTIHPDTRDFLLAHAICVGDLVDTIDPITPETNAKTFVAYLEPFSCRRRVGLVFQNVERIKPFPFKGKQGIGFLSDEDVAKIETI